MLHGRGLTEDNGDSFGKRGTRGGSKREFEFKDEPKAHSARNESRGSLQQLCRTKQKAIEAIVKQNPFMSVPDRNGFLLDIADVGFPVQVASPVWRKNWNTMLAHPDPLWYIYYIPQTGCDGSPSELHAKPVSPPVSPLGAILGFDGFPMNKSCTIGIPTGIPIGCRIGFRQSRDAEVGSKHVFY